MDGLSRSGIIALLALFLYVPVAHADLERSLDDPTAWWWLHGVSAAEITDLINDEGARLVDLEIEDDSPLRFSAAFVHNSGPYASGWWWLFDQTSAQIGDFLSANTARLIDLERYETVSGTRWAAVMVPNTGSQAKTWWWYTGRTEVEVNRLIIANGARLVDLESHVSGSTRYFDVVMISNTGADASDWWWYFDLTEAEVQNVLTDTGARILDLEAYDLITERRFHVILKANPSGQYWWWWWDKTAAEVTDLINQHGARIVDIEPYSLFTLERYAVVMLNNSNELTTTIATQMGYDEDGVTGFYLKRVNGPVLANINEAYAFEPSSTLKVLHHLHTMREVAAGNENLSSSVTYSTALSGSCPTGGSPFETTSLETVLFRMMHFSDNAATMAIKDRYGIGAIIDTGVIDVGMSTVQLLRDMGCGPLFDSWDFINRTTLLDLAMLYEGVANGVYLSGADRDDFYRLMQNDQTAPPQQWWFTNALENIVAQEAANLGIPGAAPSFLAAMEWAWKPGGDTMYLPDRNEFRSVAGWVSIPVCERRIGGVQNQEYVFGLFVHAASDSTYADNRLGLASELFRDLIRDALLTCPTSAPDSPTVAAPVRLQQIAPTPFNARTTVTFALAEASYVRLEVMDVRGRRIGVLAHRFFEAGEHSVVWDGRDVTGMPAASGTYVVRVQAGDLADARTVVLVK